MSIPSSATTPALSRSGWASGVAPITLRWANPSWTNPTAAASVTRAAAPSFERARKRQSNSTEGPLCQLKIGSNDRADLFGLCSPYLGRNHLDLASQFGCSLRQRRHNCGIRPIGDETPNHLALQRLPGLLEDAQGRRIREGPLELRPLPEVWLSSPASPGHWRRDAQRPYRHSPIDLPCVLRAGRDQHPAGDLLGRVNQLTHGLRAAGPAPG